MLKAPAGTPSWGLELVRQIDAEFMNRALLPARLPAFAKAALPDPVRFKNCWIKVPDDAGGDVPAFSDGTNWRRCTDRNVIS